MLSGIEFRYKLLTLDGIRLSIWGFGGSLVTMMGLVAGILLLLARALPLAWLIVAALQEEVNCV